MSYYLKNRQKYYNWIPNLFLFSRLKKTKYIKQLLFSTFLQSSILEYSKYASQHHVYNCFWKKKKSFIKKQLEYIWKKKNYNTKILSKKQALIIHKFLYMWFLSNMKFFITSYRYTIKFFKVWISSFIIDIFKNIPTHEIDKSIWEVQKVLRKFKKLKIHTNKKKLKIHKNKKNLKKIKSINYRNTKIHIPIRKKFFTKNSFKYYYLNNKNIIRTNEYNKYALTFFFFNMYNKNYKDMKNIYIGLRDQYKLKTFYDFFNLLNKKIDIFLKEYYSLFDFEIDIITQNNQLKLNDVQINNKDFIISHYSLLTYSNKKEIKYSGYQHLNNIDFFTSHKWYFFLIYTYYDFRKNKLNYKNIYIQTKIKNIFFNYLKIKLLQLNNISNFKKLILKLEDTSIQANLLILKPLMKKILIKKSTSLLYTEILKTNMYFEINNEWHYKEKKDIYNYKFIEISSKKTILFVNKIILFFKISNCLNNLCVNTKKKELLILKKNVWIRIITDYIYNLNLNLYKEYLILFNNAYLYSTKLYKKLIEFNIDTNDIFTQDTQNTDKKYLYIYTKQINSIIPNEIDKSTGLHKRCNYEETINKAVKKKEFIELQYIETLNYKEYGNSKINKKELLFFLHIIRNKPLFIKKFIEDFENEKSYFYENNYKQKLTIDEPHFKERKDIDLFDYKNTIGYNERKNVIQYFFLNHQFKYYRYKFKRKKNIMFIHKIPNIDTRSYNFRWIYNFKISSLFKEPLVKYF
jgi:hypothetical protein